jgi:predicted Ser/Thr protein kinase
VRFQGRGKRLARSRSSSHCAPQGQYHNQEYFLDIIKEKYKKNFEEEIASAMSIANKEEYRLYLERYIKHVVAYLKNQKLHDKATNTYEAPSQDLMANVELPVPLAAADI